MLILALDTSTRAGSMALVRDGQVISRDHGDPSRPHAERLPGDLVRLLEGHLLGLEAVDAFAVAAGPGSFTGLRIGIATIQGLAFALGRPVVAVSVLDALAVLAADNAPSPAPLVAAFMDAQRNEVFAALYRAKNQTGFDIPGERGSENQPGSDFGPGNQTRSDFGLPVLELLDGPVSEPPAKVLERWRGLSSGESISFAGDGILRYLDLVNAQVSVDRLADSSSLLAPVIGLIGCREMRGGGGTRPHAIRPIYVRRSDAELARDRMQLPQKDPEPHA